MSYKARAAQVTVRIHLKDKEILERAANESGMDASAAIRQMIEMLARRVEAGGDLLDALYETKTALKASSQQTRSV